MVENRPVRLRLRISGAIALGAGWTARCAAQALTSVQVATVPSSAVFVTHAPNDYSRLFIAEQGGRVRIVTMPGDALVAAPFIPTLPNLLSDDEKGLLGLAFHPKYQENGYVYVFSTRAGGPWGSGTRVVERFTRSDANPNAVDPASARVVIRMDRPVDVHIGGWIGFGPDGFLYIAVGESTTFGSLILTDNLFGKILRIDPDGDDFPSDGRRNYRIPPGNPFVNAPGDGEIWAYGLRNPWRCAFDAATGAFYIADVGACCWEELDYQPPGVGGRSYGFPCYEGASPFWGAPPCPDPDPALHRLPLLVYGHTQVVGPLNATGCAIMGGEVYRGCAMPALQGTYFFGDLCGTTIYTMRTDGVSIWELRARTGELVTTFLTSFGTDAYGEMYYCDGASVRRIVGAPGTPFPDCNQNGRPDPCEVLAGADADHDGRPDDCACRTDWNHDGRFAPDDVAGYMYAWYNSVVDGGLQGDFDRDGRVDPADAAEFVVAWFAALRGACP